MMTSTVADALSYWVRRRISEQHPPRTTTGTALRWNSDRSLYVYAASGRKVPDKYLPKYLWQPERGTYIYARSQRKVPEKYVVRAISEYADQVKGTLRGYAQDLIDGSINVAEFQRRMADEIKSSHIAAYSVGRGGREGFTPRDFGKIGGMLRQRQYKHLDGFAQAIANGELTEAQILDRAGRYAGQVNGFYGEGFRQSAAESEATHERRVMNPAKENCPDCIEFAKAGWQPIGNLPAIGQSRCDGNCGCYFEKGIQLPDGSIVPM